MRFCPTYPDIQGHSEPQLTLLQPCYTALFLCKKVRYFAKLLRTRCGLQSLQGLQGLQGRAIISVKPQRYSKRSGAVTSSGDDDDGVVNGSGATTGKEQWVLLSFGGET